MKITHLLFVPLILFTAVGCANAQPTLKDAFKNQFRVGAAINEAQFFETKSNEVAIIQKQFNTITPENVLKWEVIHPLRDQFNFTPGDGYVAFGGKNKMFTIGHTLVWHSQTPNWVFEKADGSPADRATLLNTMSNHIATVVGRYKGRVQGWDVVNEALSDNGSLRQTKWLKIIGEDYLVKAFEFAHAADPDAELYYNDYALENPAKRDGAVALVKKLQVAGVHVTAIGSQTHARMDWPTTGQLAAMLSAFEKLGVKVNITELDLDVLPAASGSHSADVGLKVAQNPKLNPYPQGLPAAMQSALAQRYAELFAVFNQHSAAVDRVTFWGVTDANSWLNNWPVHGRTSYPLLFDRAGKPKLAYLSVIKTAASEKSAALKKSPATSIAAIRPPE